MAALKGKGEPPEIRRSGKPSLPRQTTSAAPQLPKSSTPVEGIAAASKFDDNSNGIDKISHLPDEILVSIISRLKVVEAVSTSILSTRWRLHTYITRLDFSPTSKQQKYFERNFDQVVPREEFIKYTINHTLDSHKGGQVLDVFRLCLPIFTWSYESSETERWLEFAFSKQVQIIDLHLHARCPWASFPFVSCLASKNEALVPAFKSLKQLSFGGIDVGDEDLELLLSNFVVLESLSVENSTSLSVVSIVGPLKLMHLNISSCLDIESVEIRDATNLVSLKFYNLPSSYDLLLENVPRLVEFDTDENYGFCDILLDDTSSEQLVKLKISTMSFNEIRYDDVDDLLLVKLKHMELAANIENGCNIHQLVHIIQA